MDHMLEMVASSKDIVSRVERSVLMDCAQQLRELVASFVDWSKRVSVQRKKFYFGPTIRVPLRATQAEAKRANAKQ
jgi:hypothetical protein